MDELKDPTSVLNWSDFEVMKRLMICIALLLGTATTLRADERYRVKYFDCYIVGLYGVFDGDKMVSKAYGYGAVGELTKMAKRWNKLGRNAGDEEKLFRTLQRKGMGQAVVQWHSGL